jgi:iron-sulfur cluster assembly protein
MFQLTPAAAAQVVQAAQQQPDQAANPMLRIAAKLDNGEIVYGMGFDEERENDLVIPADGVTVLIAPPSQPLLDETVLDFLELHPGEFQFIFINPKDGPLDTAPQGGGCAGCGKASSCGTKQG